MSQNEVPPKEIQAYIKEHPIQGIPPVPDYKEVTDRAGVVSRRCAYITLVVFVILILAMLLGVPFVLISGILGPHQHPTRSNGQSTAGQSTPGQSPSPTPGPQGITKATTQFHCPDAKPVTPSVSPSLDFCSPKYIGDVAGPYGTHITLVAENMPDIDHTDWELIKSASSFSLGAPTVPTPDTTTLQKCTKQDGCTFLRKPQATSLASSSFLLYWTWKSTEDFPSTPGNYFLVAHKVNSASFVVSSVAFSLLTSQPPCIMISIDGSGSKPGDCSSTSSASSISIKSGDKLTITGSNWQSWGSNNYKQSSSSSSETVTISATCNCSTLLFTSPITATVKADGTFSTLPIPITTTHLNNYEIQAFCAVQPEIATPGADPGSSSNTIVDNALTFGHNEMGDETSLTLLLQAS